MKTALKVPDVDKLAAGGDAVGQGADLPGVMRTSRMRNFAVGPRGVPPALDLLKMEDAAPLSGQAGLPALRKLARP